MQKQTKILDSGAKHSDMSLTKYLYKIHILYAGFIKKFNTAINLLIIMVEEQLVIRNRIR